MLTKKTPQGGTGRAFKTKCIMNNKVRLSVFPSQPTAEKKVAMNEHHWFGQAPLALMYGTMVRQEWKVANNYLIINVCPK